MDRRRKMPGGTDCIFDIAACVAPPYVATAVAQASELVGDAVGAPGEAAYEAALLNYSMIANAVWTTEQAVKFLK